MIDRGAPDFGRAVALARRERAMAGGVQATASRRGALLGLVIAGITVISAAGVHGGASRASLDAATDGPIARTREVDVMKSKVAVVGAVAIGLAANAYAQNLLSNGSFESGATQDCGWICVGVGDTRIAGWSVTLNSVDRERTSPPSCPPEGWLPYDGEYSIDLNGCSVGGILQQSVATIPGRLYRLDFQLSLNAGIDVGRLRVHVNSLTADFSAPRVNAPIQPWAHHEVSFTADSTTTVIAFESLNREYSWQWAGPVIDAVSLQEVNPNLIVNGGFEDGLGQTDCTWVVYANGSTQLPGWEVIAGSIDRERLSSNCAVNTESWTSFEGEFTVDLDGASPGGAIRQFLALTPGDRYRLSFALTGNCGAAFKRVRAQAGTASGDFEFHCSPSNPQPWTQCSLDFTASPKLTGIVIRSLSDAGQNGPVIDSVSVVRVLAPCPADIVVDSFVGGSDLAALLTAWGTNGGDVPRADTNGDGIVDGSDLATVLGAWGPCG